MKKILFFVSIFLLCNCASSPAKTNQIPTQINLGENKGAIFGTLTIYKKPKFTKYQINFDRPRITLPEDANNVVLINTNRGGLSDTQVADFSTNENTASYLFYFERIPDEFYFYNVSIFKQTGMNVDNVFTFKRIKLPFTIEPGKIKYVGEFIIDPNTENLIYMNDSYERDVKIFSEKYPKIDWKNSVKNNIFEIKMN